MFSGITAPGGEDTAAPPRADSATTPQRVPRPGPSTAPFPSIAAIVWGISSFCFFIHSYLGSFVFHSQEQFICSWAPQMSFSL